MSSDEPDWAEMDADDYESLARNVGLEDRVKDAAAREATRLASRQHGPRGPTRPMQRFSYLSALLVCVCSAGAIVFALIARGPSAGLGLMLGLVMTWLFRLVYPPSA